MNLIFQSGILSFLIIKKVLLQVLKLEVAICNFKTGNNSGGSIVW